jgi:hypothetical protein
MVCALGSPVFAIAAPQEALLLLRSLAYDRNLGQRSQGAAVTLALLSSSKDPASTAACAALHEALSALVAKHVTVAGKPVQVIDVSAEVGAFADKIRGSAALVVCETATTTKDLSSMTRHGHILSYTTREDLVRAGLAVGFVDKGGKPTIMINLPACQAEGVDFESAFLQVAEVLR